MGHKLETQHWYKDSELGLFNLGRLYKASVSEKGSHYLTVALRLYGESKAIVRSFARVFHLVEEVVFDFPQDMGLVTFYIVKVAK
jgi:hypothetical protein